MSGGKSSTKKAELRRNLAKRDGLSCFYCPTVFASPAEATIDHLIPQSKLPGWPLFNLVLACPGCNHDKGDTLPQSFLRGKRRPPVRRPWWASALARIAARLHEFAASVELEAAR